jgi:lysozyme
MILGCDVSSWQPAVDWDLLRSKGVEFAIAKASQGSYAHDRLLASHLTGANKAGMISAAYHWCDPLSKDIEQADFFIKAIHGLPVSFLAVDMEQHWADWQEWSLHTIQKVIDPERISESARVVAERLRQQSGLPVVIYSRVSFIEQYAQPVLSWITDYPLWLAQYPYGATRVKCSWEELQATRLPKIPGPTLLAGCSRWSFWQFSGDKFILPGCDNALDLDYFNGNLDELKVFCSSQTEVKEEAKAETLETWVTGIDSWARRMGYTGAKP